jgi:peptidoglycan hydrolase-like protein with peptidoglycan-binding domain
MIGDSVGRGGNNNSIDTLVIQNALNVIHSKNSTKWIAVDGLVGPETIGSITAFQSRRHLIADGRVDPNGSTLKKLRSDMGSDIAVFAPVLVQLMPYLTELGKIQQPKDYRIAQIWAKSRANLYQINRYIDVANIIQARHIRPISMMSAAPVIGVVIVDDVIILMFLIFIIVMMLTILSQSPAFKKDVEVRAKELERILHGMQQNAAEWADEAINIGESIVSDTDAAAVRCRNSPTFIASPECEEAIRNYKNRRIRIKDLIRQIKDKIRQFRDFVRKGWGGLPITEINRLVNALQKELLEIQLVVSDMRDRCKCPDA